MELEFFGGGGQSDSTAHAELFMSVGSAVQAAKAVFLRSENTTSALARALLSPEIVAALRQVREASGSVQRTQYQMNRAA